MIQRFRAGLHFKSLNFEFLNYIVIPHNETTIGRESNDICRRFGLAPKTGNRHYAQSLSGNSRNEFARICYS